MSKQQELFDDFERKHRLAIERVKTFCAGKKVLCSFSGGKDSQCVYYILKEAGVPFVAQYSITRFEPPELLDFILKNYPDCVFRRAYKKSLVDEIASSGLPTRHCRWCCSVKHVKTPGFDIAAIGVRAQESARRAATWRLFGQKQDRTYYVCPILDWTEDDVWHYLNEVVKAPHCCLYDEGYRRIGCVMCPLVGPKKMQRDMERWPKYAKMLRMGADKNIDNALARLKAGTFVKRNGEPVSKDHVVFADNPKEEYWRRWILTAQIAKPIDEALNRKKGQENDAPCLFAGSGFSESDGGATDEAQNGTEE